MGTMMEVKMEELEFSSPNDTPIVYRLCRIDENGIPHPTSEEEVMEVESLIQAEYSESEEDEEEERWDDEDDYVDVENEDDDDEYDMEDANRRLLKQLEVQVVDIVSKVKAEEERAAMESSAAASKFTYKRRRRPNPKYYHNQHGNHAVDGNGNVTMVPSTATVVPPSSSDYQVVEVKTERTMDEEGICSSSRMANTNTSTNTVDANKCLDNLSIRELQDTYRDTFGRETSAKDKHWLKRKIAKGLSTLVECSRVQDRVQDRVQETADFGLADRLDVHPSAEQSFTTVYHETPEFDTIDDPRFKMVLPCSNISPTGSLDASTTTVVSRPSDGQSHLNEVQSLDGDAGKRQRKPNRRYLEDEMEMDDLGYGRIVSSPETEQQDPQDQAEYTVSQYENSDDGADDADMDLEPFDFEEELSLDEEQGGVAGGTRKRNRGFTEHKPIVKMARTARATRRDAAGTAVRKIKFKIPAAQSQDNDENYEPNEDSGDQVSCMLPNVSSDELQPSDTEDTETRKGGSRRKHHRPWTLREVMALVDGVSRCGTGKWADIKRLSFAAITYRTPVDLKDKWRNLLRASRVHAHSSRQQQGEKRRKHFSVSIPAPILARVRELAAQPGQTIKLPVIRSTRSRRMSRKQNVEDELD